MVASGQVRYPISSASGVPYPHPLGYPTPMVLTSSCGHRSGPYTRWHFSWIPTAHLPTVWAIWWTSSNMSRGRRGGQGCRSLYSGVQVEQVCTCPWEDCTVCPSWTSLTMSGLGGGVHVQWGPSWTSLNMFRGCWGPLQQGRGRSCTEGRPGALIRGDRSCSEGRPGPLISGGGDRTCTEGGLGLDPVQGFPRIDRLADTTENHTFLQLRWQAEKITPNSIWNNIRQVTLSTKYEELSLNRNDKFCWHKHDLQEKKFLRVYFSM